MGRIFDRVRGTRGSTRGTAGPGSPYQVRFDPLHPSRPDPEFSVDTSAFTSDPLTANGGIRNSRHFWNDWIDKPNSGLSPNNQALIRDGRAPIVDAEWVRRFPEHRNYWGEGLIHHHMDQGRYAIPVPDRAHRNRPGFAIWHPRRN